MTGPHPGSGARFAGPGRRGGLTPAAALLSVPAQFMSGLARAGLVRASRPWPQAQLRYVWADVAALAAVRARLAEITAPARPARSLVTGTLTRSCKYFTARAVRWLAQAGIGQFPGIGCGWPFHDRVHEIAARHSRVVHAGNDTGVMTHARALLAGTATVSTGHIHAGLNDPGPLLDQARTGLDVTRPVAVLLMRVLRHTGDPGRDDRRARTIIWSLKDALPAGSYLAISEITTCDPALTTALAACSQAVGLPCHPRGPAQVTDLSDGLSLIGPSVVPISQWRPGPGPFTPPPVLGRDRHSHMTSCQQPAALEICGGCARAVVARASAQRENSGLDDNNRPALKTRVVTRADVAHLGYGQGLSASPRSLLTAVPWGPHGRLLAGPPRAAALVAGR